MIITTDNNQIKIEKHLRFKTAASFTLVRNMTKEVVFTSENIDSSDYYYIVEIAEIPTGEYTYILRDSRDNIIESGLLLYGEINSNVIEHNNENRTYIYGED